MSRNVYYKTVLMLMNDLRSEHASVDADDGSQISVTIKRPKVEGESVDKAASLDDEYEYEGEDEDEEEEEKYVDKNFAEIPCPLCGVITIIYKGMPHANLICCGSFEDHRFYAAEIKQLLLTAFDKSQDVGKVSNKGSLDRQQEFVDLLQDRYYTLVNRCPPAELKERNKFYNTIHYSLDHYSYLSVIVICERTIKKLIEGTRTNDIELYISNYLELMAFSFRKTNRYDDAIAVLSKVLELYKVALGDKHLAIAITLNNLGICHAKLENFSEALTSYQSALPIIQANSDKVFIARQFGYLGALHQMQNQFDSAEGFYVKALDHYPLVLPKSKNQERKNVIQNLTICYLKQKKIKEAEDLQKRY